MLQDEAAADAFADFIQSVTEKRDRLLTAVTCTLHGGGDGDGDGDDSGDNSDSNDRGGGLEDGTCSAVKISKGPR